MYISTVALSACGGCEASMLSVGEPLVALLSDHTVSFSSLLVDKRSMSPSDVVLVSGCLRNSDERLLAGEVSRMSRKVVALGTCATYGGVAGLKRLRRPAEEPEQGSLPFLLAEAAPLDTEINVELYVPGCPPSPLIIYETLKALLEGELPRRHETTVCSECRRRVSPKSRSGSLRSHPGPGIKGADCLLNGGLMCLGPVTRGGCMAACPAVAAVCSGCRGPSDAVLSSQLHSLFSDMVYFISSTTKQRPEKIEKQARAMLDTIYMFTARDPVIKSKVRGRAPVG
jgi:F420-non-reducing hydrogenase small subunit